MTDILRELETVLHDAAAAAWLAVDSDDNSHLSAKAANAHGYAVTLTERLVRQALKSVQAAIRDGRQS